MYKSYISSNGYEQIFGVGFSGNRGYWTTWFMAIEKGITIINHEILSWPYVQEKKHISGWWFQPTILKNDGVKVNGKDDIPYRKWKIKVMFETTNQVYLHLPSGYLT